MKKLLERIEFAFFETDHHKEWKILISYLIIGLVIFSTSFLNLNFFWDDEQFVFLNPEVINIKNYFDYWNPNTHFFRAWPLGYTLFSSLFKLFSYKLYYYKLLNIVIHCLNAFLIFKISKQNDLKWPFIIGFISLIHPLNVEVVSWTFQLLTLSAFSFLLLAIFFLRIYFNRMNILNYFLALFLFCASLWTKSIGVFFPFFFFLFTWLYVKNIWKSVFITLPFFVISLLIGSMTLIGSINQLKMKSYEFTSDSVNISLSRTVTQLYSKIYPIANPEVNDDVKYQLEKQYYDSIIGIPKVGLKKIEFNRWKIFAYSFAFYPSQLFLPLEQSFIYSQQFEKHFYLHFFLTIALVLSFFYFVNHQINSRKRFVFFLYSIVSLAPYIGFSFITFFYWSFVSDRYAYVLIPLLPAILVRLEYTKIKRVLLIYSFLLIALNLKYGFLFNQPIKLYEKVLEHKSHPAIYMALFEEYINKQDFKSAEEWIRKGKALFPLDERINSGIYRINIYKKNFED